MRHDRPYPSEARVRALLDETLHLPRRGDAVVPDSLIEMSHDGLPMLVAFSSMELAVGADIGQTDVLMTSVWDALRMTRTGTGLVIDPGQDGEVLISDELVEQVIGGPRESALPLSPRALVTFAQRPVVVMEDDAGKLVGARPPVGAVAAWTDLADATRAAPFAAPREVQLGRLASLLPTDAGIVLDPLSPWQKVFDGDLLAALRGASGLFPAGHEIVLRPHAEGIAGLADLPGATRAWAAHYEISGLPPRLLLIVEGDPAAVRIKPGASDLPVVVTSRADLPDDKAATLAQWASPLSRLGEA